MQNHKFHSSILREYDVRGVVNDTLSASDAYAIGRSFGTIVNRDGGTKVAIGYDGRLSSIDLANSLIRGLNDTGIDVLQVGRGPTPMLYFSVYKLRADAGIMVTGSHNPPEYNGFKMMWVASTPSLLMPSARKLYLYLSVAVSMVISTVITVSPCTSPSNQTNRNTLWRSQANESW